MGKHKPNNKGCKLCADAYRDKYGCVKCKHINCPYEEKEELKWWQKVGGKTLIPEGVAK